MAKKKKTGFGAIGEIAAKAGSEAAKPVAIILGLTASAVAGNLLDKVIKPEPPPEDGTKKFQVKALIKPVALLGGGAAIAYFGRKSDLAKHFGYGMIAGGTISGVKVFIQKDLFAGLGQTDEQRQKELARQFFDESQDEVKKLMAANRFTSELPALSAPPYASELDTENVQTIL